jgi:hypothetical protein
MCRWGVTAKGTEYDRYKRTAAEHGVGASTAMRVWWGPVTRVCLRAVRLAQRYVLRPYRAGKDLFEGVSYISVWPLGLAAIRKTV